MDRRDRWLAVGLFLTTLATLLVELLDTRLLSVLTWYHVSFLAVSLAMLGTAAGAIALFLAEARLALYLLLALPARALGRAGAATAARSAQPG